MKYKAIFSNSKGTVETEISDENPDYFFPMAVYGVTVETDGFESLTIDNPEQYAENQLTQFEYDLKYPYIDKKKALLVLKNYRLMTFIPIHVRDIDSGERIEADIQITIYQTEETVVLKTCSLLGKSSEKLDWEVGFQEIQAQLADSYCMETCSNCKNSWWHPYGGNDFFNQLCFKSEAEAFQRLTNKDKMSVARFMKYGKDENFRRVLLPDYCDKFEPRSATFAASPQTLEAIGGCTKQEGTSKNVIARREATKQSIE
jgi:hypothetical protein